MIAITAYIEELYLGIDVNGFAYILPAITDIAIIGRIGS